MSLTSTIFGSLTVFHFEPVRVLAVKRSTNPMRGTFSPVLFTLRVVAIILCSTSLGATFVQAQVYKGVQLVKADLLADTSSIVPGKPFTVGLRLQMAPHWHTYWQNSGDAGLPTKIAWQLPDGFKAGALQWPIPTRIDSAGDIVNYGYSEQAVLLTEITPPAQLPPGEISLRAKADWLVCADLCVPGEANLALRLPTGSGEAAAANIPVFTEAARPSAETRKRSGGRAAFQPKQNGGRQPRSTI